MKINKIIDSINESKKEDPNNPRWDMVLDGASVEIEVAEFLYSFVRMTKPKRILETGTNVGYSTIAMAQALKDNHEQGVIDTLDITDYSASFVDFDNINKILQPSLSFEPIGSYDLIFLDSLRELLYAEFVKYWDVLNDDGYVLIHDVRTQPEKKETVDLIEQKYNLVSINLRSARGLSLFHKINDVNLLKHGDFNWRSK